uniref:Uncharacterized protein n=1 Tax=Setaria digitata TaxID=48799 RepID=A0A915PWY8_9BILA
MQSHVKKKRLGFSPESDEDEARNWLALAKLAAFLPKDDGEENTEMPAAPM